MSGASSYARRVPVGRSLKPPWCGCAHAPVRRRWLAVALVVCSAGGCGSSHITLQRVPSTTSAGGSSTGAPKNSGTGSTAIADGGQDPAILSAYQGSLADFNAVADRAPVQGNSLTLSNHMTGEKLRTVQAALLNLSLANEFNSGSLTSLNARVTQFNGTEAVVESCELDRVAVNSLPSGKVVTPPSNGTELVNELVQLTGDVWKVARGSQVREGCS